MEWAAGPLSNLKAVKQESQMKSVFNEEKLQNQSENHNQHWLNVHLIVLQLFQMQSKEDRAIRPPFLL